jgi:hypothetical protein
MSVAKPLAPGEWQSLARLYDYGVAKYRDFFRVEGFIRSRGITRTRYQVVTDLIRMHQETGNIAYSTCATRMRSISARKGAFGTAGSTDE